MRMTEERIIAGVMCAVALRMYEHARARLDRLEPLLADGAVPLALMPLVLRAQADEIESYDCFTRAALVYAGKTDDEVQW